MIESGQFMQYTPKQAFCISKPLDLGRQMRCVKLKFIVCM